MPSRASQQLDLGAGFGTWEWDLATDESTFSDELYAILALSPETAAPGLGAFTSCAHADDAMRVAVALERVRKDGKRAELEYRVVRNAVRFVRMHAWRAPDARRMTVLVEDVTSHSAITDRLSSVSSFAAGVAHEINNPLGFLSANVELIARELELAGVAPSADLDVLLREARHGIQRIHTIVRGLMTFSRIEPTHHEPLDLNRVLEVAIGIANAELRQRARIVRTFTPLPPVDANAARLGQVFVNLLVNAAQAIPPGRPNDHEVAIATSVDSNHRVVVQIRDTGRGIPRAVGARVFEAFVTTKPTGTGPGLGLTVCRNIVHAAGGEIGFESEPGRTTFTVKLPAAVAPVAQHQPPAIAKRRGSVLVVDDETVFTGSLRRLLNREYEVAIARDGHDALARILAGERFDVIICDFRMPGLTGTELHAAIPVEQAQRMIFITGGNPDEIVLLERMTNPCFDKPCDLDALRAAIRRLVG